MAAYKPKDENTTIGSAVGQLGQQKADKAGSSLASAATETKTKQEEGRAKLDLGLAAPAPGVETEEQKKARLEQENKDIAKSISDQSGLLEDDKTTESKAGKLINTLGSGMKAEFKGPSEIANKVDLEDKADRLSTMGDLTTSEVGRKQLLRDTITDPRYASRTGAQSLDLAHLGQSSKDLGKVLALRRLGGQFGANLAKSEAAVADTAKRGVEEAGEIRARTADIAGKATEGTMKALEDAKAAWEKKQADIAAGATIQQDPERVREAETLSNLIAEGVDDPELRGQLEDMIGGDQLLSLFGTSKAGTLADISNIDPRKLAIYNKLLDIQGKGAAQIQATRGEDEALQDTTLGIDESAIRTKMQEIAPALRENQEKLNYYSNPNSFHKQNPISFIEDMAKWESENRDYRKHPGYDTYNKLLANLDADAGINLHEVRDQMQSALRIKKLYEEQKRNAAANAIAAADPLKRGTFIPKLPKEKQISEKEYQANMAKYTQAKNNLTGAIEKAKAKYATNVQNTLKSAGLQRNVAKSTAPKSTSLKAI